jgi:glucose/arabinose dehydrogenase
MVAGLVLPAVPAQAAIFPNDPGFSDTLVGNVPVPTSISFASSGRMLVTTQSGDVRIFVAGMLQPTPATTIPVCTGSEQGLLGSAITPTNDVFLYYTSSHDGDCWNRVSRFTLGPDNLLSGEVVLLDWIPTPATNHNAGDLNFGPDGKLYVSVGDGGCQLVGSNCAGLNDNARQRTHLLGKILRLNLDGTVPADNPYAGANTRRCGHPAGDTNPGSTAFCSETWAWGLRNPFRFAFRSDGLMYINDVGQAAREEVDSGTAGADYGWNCREGLIANPLIPGCTVAGAQDPVLDYDRSAGCVTITGGAFIPASVWPSAYSGKYLFSDFGCGKIFLFDGSTVRDFVTELGSSSAVHLEFGPDGALYYSSYASGGEVRRVAPVRKPIPSDFDGDVKSDIGVYRPSNGIWYVSGSSSGTTVINWGSSGDIPAAADYDGDGKTDFAVFRPSSGVWYVNRSSGGMTALNWGANGDRPMPGDYDGDGRADIAVYRPSSGVWYISLSAGGTSVVNWGSPGDLPAGGDFDGDGKTDLAVFRPSSGIWYVNRSSGGTTALNWGANGDIPKSGDFDGDGKTDIAVYRPSSGVWYISRSSGGTTVVNWGSPGDLPASGDYDGDGKSDLAILRPSTGIWYVQRSGGGTTILNWGAAGDIPVGPPPS